QNQAQPKKEEQPKQADQKPADAQKKDDQQQAEDQPKKAGEMTPEEAKKLLDAQKDNEELLRMKPPEKPRNPLHAIKDW
ncbi:MAG: hypothetical protein P4M10_07470, partial [Verrucomicrobiae bacterium]|nr:hypothetical protein [Verrucomicrobiae bacterium]